MKRRILATAALPYANGPIHIGHLLEYIQADIWVRFMRLMGHEVYYICADDTHGTAVMLSSKKANMEPEKWIESMKKKHLEDFESFGIQFSHYGSTHHEFNKEATFEIYQKLKESGAIKKRTISQLYDENEGIFLSDRHVKGSCPHCLAKEQYGDNCEKCGHTYNASELLEPRSIYSNKPPVLKESEHLFFELPKYQNMLLEWVKKGALSKEVSNKLLEWLDGELRPWDISRDAPYFGFEIPGEPSQYFYVWVDAPVGYIGSFREFLNQSQLPSSLEEEFFSLDAEGKTELIHFIGKDITYFHGLFWPALLHASSKRKPSAIFAHGFLTLNGEKMSKSKGTFIEASLIRELASPEATRYYLAAHLDGSVSDIDFNPERFVELINSDIVGKLVNIASRCAKLLEKYQDSTLSEEREASILAPIQESSKSIELAYEERNTAKATRKIMALSDTLNSYISEQAPWKAAKEKESFEMAMKVCSTGMEGFLLLVGYLSPIMPELAENSFALFSLKPSWLPKSPKGKLNSFSPLFSRLSLSSFETLVPKKAT